MLYTLEQLRAENDYIDRPRITAAHLNEINDYIKAIEQTRTEQPQPFDDVDFTNEYGQHTEHATIDGESLTNVYLSTICENGIPHPVKKDDGTITASIGCGGAFYPYDPPKMEYIGTARKRCKIYAGDFIGGYFTIYFRAAVSRFRYDARNTEQQEATR